MQQTGSSDIAVQKIKSNARAPDSSRLKKYGSRIVPALAALVLLCLVAFASLRSDVFETAQSPHDKWRRLSWRKKLRGFFRKKKTIKRSDRTNPGKVDGLWTWGSGTLSSRPLRNALDKDGCFPGKRVLAENLDGKKDWATWLLPKVRPRTVVQDVVEITVDLSKEKSPQTPSPAPSTAWQDKEIKKIKYRGHETFKSCSEKHAWPALSAPPLLPSDGKMFGSPADKLHRESYFFNYTDSLLMKNWIIANGIKAACEPYRMYGIRMVSTFTISDPFNAISGKNDKDTVMLFQDEKLLKCYLTFAPANGESLMDIAKMIFSKSWCGLKGIGKFIVEELEALIQSPKWKTLIQDQLPKCNGLELVGHSMGGALSGILATCLNQESWDEDTYNSVMWEYNDTPEVISTETTKKC